MAKQYPRRSPVPSTGKAGGCFPQWVRGSAIGLGGVNCSPGLQALRSTGPLAPPAETRVARELPPSAPLLLRLTRRTTPPQVYHQRGQTLVEASRAIWYRPQSSATWPSGSTPQQLPQLLPALWLTPAACGACGVRQARTRRASHLGPGPQAAPGPREWHQDAPGGAASHPEARRAGHRPREEQCRATEWQVRRLDLHGRPLDRPLLEALRLVGQGTRELARS